MAKLFLVELLAKFTGDTTSLDSSMSKAENLMGKFAVAAKYGATAALGAGAAFSALVVHQMHVGEELGFVADKAGDTTESIVRLGHATQLAGLSTEQLGVSLKFMQKNVFEAAAGNKELENALRRIGTSSKELLNMTTTDAFRKILSGLQGLGSAAERTRIAMQLLGRSGQDVLTVARKGGDYFQKMAEEADRFGLTISRIDSEALNDANDSVSRLGDAASGAARQFAVGLAPAITTVNERLLEVIDVSSFFRKAGEWTGDVWVAAVNRIEIALSQWEQAFIKVNALAKGFMADSKEESVALQQIADARINAIQNRLDLAAAGKSSSLITEYDAELARLKKENADLKNHPKSTMGGGVNVPLSESALKDAKKAADDYAKHLEDAYKKTIDYNNATADSFIEIKDAFMQGGKAADIFKKVALNALNDVANNLIRMSFGGTPSGGGILSSIAASIFGGVTGGAYGGGTSMGSSAGLINWLPAGQSFAVGTPYVPHDMIAQIHEGEAIIPKGQNKMGGTTVIQNISIGAGVQGTIRAELAKALPDLKKAAIAGVSDASLRGNMG